MTASVFYLHFVLPPFGVLETGFIPGFDRFDLPLCGGSAIPVIAIIRPHVKERHVNAFGCRYEIKTFPQKRPSARPKLVLVRFWPVSGWQGPGTPIAERRDTKGCGVPNNSGCRFCFCRRCSRRTVDSTELGPRRPHKSALIKSE